MEETKTVYLLIFDDHEPAGIFDTEDELKAAFKDFRTKHWWGHFEVLRVPKGKLFLPEQWDEYQRYCLEDQCPEA